MPLVRLEKIKAQEAIAEERVATLQRAVMLFQSGLATAELYSSVEGGWR
jgi:hypothetical protein